MKLRWSFLFLLFLIPLNAQAEIFAENSGISGSNYFGVQLSGLRFNEDEFNTHESAVSMRVGREFGNYLAVEGHAVAGLENDTSQGVEVSIDYLVGVYLRGNMFLWDPRARLYAMAGVTHGKITATAFSLTDKTTDTELGYGFGFEFYGDKRNGVNIEFMRYMDGDEDGDNYEVDSISLGYIHRF